MYIPVMALTAGSVVAAGARVAERVGVEAVGVRAVAGELGVTPMALYRHVGNSAALHAAVVATLVDDLPTASASDDWRADARGWAHAARAVLARAPGLAHYVLLHWLELPAVLRSVDSLGASLEPHATDAVAAANAVFTYVLMRAQAEEQVRAEGVRRDLGTLRSHRAALPFLWRHRSRYAVARLDEHFTYGLDVILRGLA
jgi:AcrR family transcriptional regulator